MHDQETLNELLSGLRRFVNERLIPLEAEGLRRRRHPRRRAGGDARARPVRPFDPGRIRRPRPFDGRRVPGDVRVLPLLAGVSLAPSAPMSASAARASSCSAREAQKSKWLPGIASGEVVTSFALTEPEAGSDSAAVRTRAELRRRRTTSSTAPSATSPTPARASLFTRDGAHRSDVKGGGGVSAFLVPRDPPGVSVGKPEKKMGQQGAHIHDVNFDNVKVPVDNRLGEEGQGFRVAMQVLDRGALAHFVGVRRRRRAPDRGKRALRRRAQTVRPSRSPASR